MTDQCTTRLDRIAEIERAIAEGTYDVDAGVLARMALRAAEVAEEPGSRLAASITDRLTIRPATELVEPIVRKPQPARPPLSLIDKLAEFDCELSIADFASIYIDGNRSLKLKCRALKYAVKTHGIPFHGLGKRMKFDPVELIEYIRRRSFTAKKPPRAKGRDITRRIAARKK